VSLLDIFPTLVSLSGGSVFPQMEGISLAPILQNPDASREEPAITTFHYNNHSIRTERWRYIKYNNGDEELYDHNNDPDEFYNLANLPGYREIIKDLSSWPPKVNFEE